MLSDNIKYYRRQRGFSQEEMAVRLHVVRQTVSKWEHNLSVPDAEVLIQIASLLEVPVSKLLGIEEGNDTGNPTIEELTAELAQLNEQLAQKQRRELLVKRMNEKRGLLLFLSFLSMILAVNVDNEILSIALSAACLLLAVIILYRNLALFTSLTTDDLRMAPLRITTFFNIGLLILCAAVALMTASGIISWSARQENLFAMTVIAGILIFTGMISPRLPYNRHTGLRLPWTVRDEDTWNLAHRILGYLSLPLAFLYVACSMTIHDFKSVTMAVILLWIGIPGGISYVYYRKKARG